jgi:hypothetical protein
MGIVEQVLIIIGCGCIAAIVAYVITALILVDKGKKGKDDGKKK